MPPKERDLWIEWGEVDFGPHVDRAVVAQLYRGLAEQHDVRVFVAPDGELTRTPTEDAVEIVRRDKEIWVARWPASLSSLQEEFLDILSELPSFWL